MLVERGARDAGAADDLRHAHLVVAPSQHQIEKRPQQRGLGTADTLILDNGPAQRSLQSTKRSRYRTPAPEVSGATARHRLQPPPVLPTHKPPECKCRFTDISYRKRGPFTITCGSWAP